MSNLNQLNTNFIDLLDKDLDLVRKKLELEEAKREKLTQQGIEAGLMPKTVTSTIKSHDKLGGML